MRVRKERGRQRQTDRQTETEIDRAKTYLEKIGTVRKCLLFESSIVKRAQYNVRFFYL